MQNRSTKGPSSKGNPINNNYVCLPCEQNAVQGIDEDEADDQEEYIDDAFNAEEVDD